MKKSWNRITLHILLIFMVSLIPFDNVVSANPVEMSETFSVESVQGGIAITGYEGKSNEIIIPEQIQGNAVVEIQAEAFSGMGFNKILIPESVNRIHDRAFYLSGVEDITIEGNDVVLGEELTDANNYFRRSYQSSGKGTYRLNTRGFWEREATDVQKTLASAPLSLKSSFSSTLALDEVGVNLGFENGLSGWNFTSDGVVDESVKTIEANVNIWNMTAYGSKMAVLEPKSNTNEGIDNLQDTMKFSQISKEYITDNFGQDGITNFTYIYQDIFLTEGDSLSFSWNYTSVDYEPYNDGSLVTMTEINNTDVYPKINGGFTQVAILGATVSGTGNYSTGDYGSTGWQSVNLYATVSGTYRIGFTVFNLDDMSYSPVLLVDNGVGITTKNGSPFMPISPDDNPPPAFKVASLSYSAKTFQESTEDDGSIENKITVTLSNDTFQGVAGEPFEPVLFSNYPLGLTPKAVKTGSNTVEISFEGQALLHEMINSVSDFTVEFLDEAFTTYGVEETDNIVTSDLMIQFKEFGIVEFDTDSDSVIENMRVEKGTLLTKPKDPTKPGYAFDGWYSNQDKTDGWNFESPFMEDSIVLYAKWTPKSDTEYVVHHYQEKMDGSGYLLFEEDNLTGTTGTIVSPEPNSYTGFTYDSENSEAVSSGKISGDGSLVLKLFYDRNKYELTFMDWDNALLHMENVPYGADVIAPSTPMRTGYSFTGWSLDVPETMPAESLTFSAMYAINSYTLTFDSKGGSAVEPVTKEYGAEVGIIQNPTREGYSFIGWDKVIPEFMPAGDVHFEAQWQINTYNVFFQENGGAEVVDLIKNYGALLGPAPETLRNGYIFEGWYKEASLENKWDFEEDRLPAEDTTLYAKWTAKTDTVYKVKYFKEALDGTFAEFEEASFTGTTDTTVTATEKTYTGFTLDNEHEDHISSGELEGDGALVLRLYYVRNEFDVAFVDWDGTVLKEMTLKYEEGAKAPTDGLIREGYTFTQWDKDFTKVTEDLIVTAIYEINTYEASFMSNEGTQILPQMVVFGSLVTEPSEPARAGYDFAGWYQDEEMTEPWNFEEDAMPAKDITLYAKWTARTDTEYKVKHYREGLDGIYVEFEEESFTGTTGATVNAVEKSYTGFTFNEEHEDEVSAGIVLGDGTLVLELYYDRNEYLVNFDSENGSDVPSGAVSYDDLVTEPSEPAKAGYDFAGWYQDEEMTEPWNFAEDAMPAKDITLYAKWTARTDTEYKVKHYREGLDGIYVEFEEESFTGTTGATVNAVEKSYTGFTFNEEHEDEVSAGIVLGDGTLVLELYYDRNEYRVIFKDFDKNIIFDQMMKFEEVISLPEEPVKEGYIFSGWDPEVPEKLSAENITLESLWEITDLEIVRQKIESLPALDEILPEHGDLLKEIKMLMDNLSQEELEKLDKDMMKKFNESSTVYVHQSSTDEETKVIVRATGDTYFDPNLELIVEVVEMKNLKEEVDRNLLSIRRGKEMMMAYDISLLLNNVEVQPNGLITIYLPISEELSKNYKNLEVIYVAEDGKITIMPSRRDGEYLVFETDHLSYYGIIGEQIEKLPTLGEKTNYTGFGYLLLIIGMFVAISSKKRKTA